jgi:hypothetical protein
MFHQDRPREEQVRGLCKSELPGREQTQQDQRRASQGKEPVHVGLEESPKASHDKTIHARQVHTCTLTLQLQIPSH